LKSIYYSLVIPCFNESKNLPSLFEKINFLLKNNRIQVVLVNNGSFDDSHKTILKLKPLSKNFKYLRIKKNIGYGNGILQGLRKSDGEIIGWTHADMQTNPLDFLVAIKFFNTKNNIFVKGRRYGRSPLDYFFTFSMSVFETLLFKKKMFDINAQPTAFSKVFFEKIPSPPEDFSFDLFFYFHALEQGLKIYRFPVYFGKRQFGVSSWNTGWLSRYKFISRTLQFSLELKRNMKVN
jgi:glycosyltransferase involved in cell wall biosynthesis